MPTDPVAASLTASARLLAESILDGGRLLVTGDGRAEADARHVVVEFLHPVIVGKRAVPAAARHRGRPTRRPPPRHRLRRTGPPPAVRHRHHRRARRRRRTRSPSGRPATRSGKQDAVVSYHVLWELIHVFLEALDPVAVDADDASLGALYPMLYGRSVDLDAVEQAATASTDQQAPRSPGCASRVARRVRGGDRHAPPTLIAAAPNVFTFGNGGSATDAADLAWRLGPKGWALSDDVATVTALANDVSFDVVFARQLATLARPGDAVGRAVDERDLAQRAGRARRGAAARRWRTIGLAGYDGGDMAAAGARRLLRRALVVGAPHPGDVRHAVRRDGASARAADRRPAGRAAATTAWPRLIPPSLHGTRRWRRTSNPSAVSRARRRRAAARRWRTRRRCSATVSSRRSSRDPPAHRR